MMKVDGSEFFGIFLSPMKDCLGQSSIEDSLFGTSQSRNRRVA